MIGVRNHVVARLIKSAINDSEWEQPAILILLYSSLFIDAVDQDFSSNAKGAAKDSWDTEDAPDSWDAPASKNGPKAAGKSEVTAKGSATKTAKTAGATAGKKDAAGSDKAIERARIELAKARDVADFISDGGGQGEFELLQPARKEDFDLLQQLIVTKLSTCKVSLFLSLFYSNTSLTSVWCFHL